MKNSGVQWIGDIPKCWNIEPIFKYFHDKIFLNLDYEFQRAFKFNYGTLKYKNEIGDLDFYRETYIKYSKVRKSDIVINGLNLNYDFISQRVAITPENGIITSAYIVLRPQGEQDANYFCYLFKTMDDMKLFHGMGKGIRLTLSFNELKKQKICIPPIAEQKAIADFLDTKCEEIDALLQDLDAEVKTLAEYKKSIIAETVTKGLNHNVPMKSSGIPWADTIPEHWQVDKGKYRFELRRTKGNPRNLELMSPTQKYGVIPQSQLEGVVLVKENTDLNTFRTIRKGDFCISLRSFQGGFEYSNFEGVVSPAYQVFYPIKPIVDGYFKYIFKSDGFISYINTFSMSLRDGKNIAFEDFGNSNLPIPPIEEQEAIANFLNAKCEVIEQSITSKLQQIETLKAYKSSLIYEYVTGKKQVPV